MATNPHLVPEANAMARIPKPATLNDFGHIVLQYLAKYTHGRNASSWRAMTSVTARMSYTINLIVNHLLAMDEGDPMKVAEWSCNFELETFHKSVSQQVYHQEMSQKIGEFTNRRKGNEPTSELLRDRYGLSVVHYPPRPKVPADVKGLLRGKPVFRCQEPECALSLITYTTEKAMQQHTNKEHTKPREVPLESAQQNLALTVGAELHERELTTGAAANPLMPFSNTSSTSVPYAVAQNRIQGDKANRSGLSTDLGKRNQAQQVTTRGVRDGRISRHSATSKRPVREIRAKLSSKEFEG
ncbi:gall11 coactivator [Fusarium pseudocircinatum]|uniref:Gall11 coactivator n=1 Tax=Fusarium pseudocircinatum TaxID=56676 RepID=A0A8H5UL75_9HYPO|nr:gall11 coactivator [Fusarium pseudocircinatum]